MSRYIVLINLQRDYWEPIVTPYYNDAETIDSNQFFAYCRQWLRRYDPAVFNALGGPKNPGACYWLQSSPDHRKLELYEKAPVGPSGVPRGVFRLVPLIEFPANPRPVAPAVAAAPTVAVTPV